MKGGEEKLLERRSSAITWRAFSWLISRMFVITSNSNDGPDLNTGPLTGSDHSLRSTEGKVESQGGAWGNGGAPAKV
jgi:hypothetical protein